MMGGTMTQREKILNQILRGNSDANIPFSQLLVDNEFFVIERVVHKVFLSEEIRTKK
jgi:hypothetical protein